MADKNQGAAAPEREISVDMNAADPSKAVSRRAASDAGKNLRDADPDDPPARTKAEKELFKRMGRLERNLTKDFNQQIADREAAWQREKSELQAKIDRLAVDKDGGDDAADAAHEAAVKALQDKLAAAYEKGDSAASAEITVQISKLDNQYWAKKAARAGATTRDTAKADEQRTQQTTAAKANTGPTRAGARFIAANEEWWDDPEFSVEQAGTNAIYVELVNKEGFDAKSAETYKEVARRLKAKFPDLAVKSGRGDPEDDDDDDDALIRRERAEQREQRRAGPAARIDDRGDASGATRGNRRTLSAADIKTMRDCRLDPDNDRDVVQYLKEAVALENAQ